MQFLLTPFSQNQESFAWTNSNFSEEELNWLQNKAKDSNKVRAYVGNGVDGEINPGIRRSEVNWLFNNSDTKWVFEKLGFIVSSLNARFFRFDLTGFGEAIQLTNYNSDEKGMYGWHIDGWGGPSTNPNRKLSIVLQLSDPSEYEGGNLELKTSSDQIIRIKKQRGLIVAFPSWSLHQVTPVTQGSRQSLVSWITGPAFR